MFIGPIKPAQEYTNGDCKEGEMFFHNRFGLISKHFNGTSNKEETHGSRDHTGSNENTEVNFKDAAHDRNDFIWEGG